MSLFLFTKSNKQPEARGTKKVIRNRIYRVCGGLMITAVLIIFAGFLKIIPEAFYTDKHLTFWMETLAVESFGFSWLIMGDTLFQDIITKKTLISMTKQPRILNCIFQCVSFSMIINGYFKKWYFATLISSPEAFFHYNWSASQDL